MKMELEKAEQRDRVQQANQIILEYTNKAANGLNDLNIEEETKDTDRNTSNSSTADKDQSLLQVDRVSL